MSIIEVTVKSQKGKCVFGHKTGDKIVFDGKSVKGNICYSALMVLLPKVFAMRYGVEFPWAEDKNVISNACPDGDNPVIFEIRRTKK
ncbi:TIGR04076 family protein [Candidatus Bathyarchaeota archaeon]|nr:TIGR04076 family protein [Candidatus Bathyarchaeota archaeon]